MTAHSLPEFVSAHLLTPALLPSALLHKCDCFLLSSKPPLIAFPQPSSKQPVSPQPTNLPKTKTYSPPKVGIPTAITPSALCCPTNTNANRTLPAIQIIGTNLTTTSLFHLPYTATTIPCGSTSSSCIIPNLSHLANESNDPLISKFQ